MIFSLYSSGLQPQKFCVAFFSFRRLQIDLVVFLSLEDGTGTGAAPE
jgi:hypothetical protein